MVLLQFVLFELFDVFCIGDGVDLICDVVCLVLQEFSEFEVIEWIGVVCYECSDIWVIDCNGV